MIVRWGHFSDLHFQGWSGFETADLRLTLPEALTKEKIKLDYIFITGDIFNKGKFDDETKDFIHEIAKITECKIENIIICPGNHDGKRHESRKLLLDSFISKREKNKSAEMDEYTRNLLIDMPFKDFVEAHEAITGSKPESLLDYARELDGINLYVLNTAVFAGQTYPREEPWSSEDATKEDHNLYLIDSKLIELRKNTKVKGFSNNNLNIVIGHHGVECFVEEEQNNLKTFFKNQKIDLYLCGHVHKSSNNEVSKATNARQVSCGGLFYDNYAETSFIYGELDTDTNKVKLCNYFYDKKPQWVINLAAPDPYDHGIHIYTPSRMTNLHENKLSSTVVPVLNSNSLYNLSEQRYKENNTSPSKSIIKQ